MADINQLNSWIAYAEEDYRAAKSLFALKKPLLGAVCFMPNSAPKNTLRPF